jgi:hypothetical protein
VALRPGRRTRQGGALRLLRRGNAGVVAIGALPARSGAGRLTPGDVAALICAMFPNPVARREPEGGWVPRA